MLKSCCSTLGEQFRSALPRPRVSSDDWNAGRAALIFAVGSFGLFQGKHSLPIEKAQPPLSCHLARSSNAPCPLDPFAASPPFCHSP